MKRLVLSLVTCVTLGVAAIAGSADAAPKKKVAAARRGGPAAPMAAADEINKLKGDFKWGMSPEEVMEKAVARIQSTYEERLQKTAKDPSQQDRVRKEMRSEIDRFKKTALVKFDGLKSGYDVSIIDQEFTQNTNEAMLVTKEEGASRYFFFAYDKLYKMFIAFDKEMLKGKSFQEFGQLMQQRFGKGRDVYVEEKTKKGVSRKLDHYVWGSKFGDTLRLVDRSAFYEVFCLVIADGATAEQQAEARKALPTQERGDALVEAVTSGQGSDRDSNDNIVDRITGRTVYKPGEAPAARDIVVPSPTTSPARAPTPAEVNRREPVADPDVAPRQTAKPKGKDRRPEETKGLEL